MAEIKARETARKRLAVLDLKDDLAAYAAANGGAFILYGSAVREMMRDDSDVDILVDFADAAMDDAWMYAEEACRSRQLTPDIRPRPWCSQRFLDHIARDAIRLPA